MVGILAAFLKMMVKMPSEASRTRNTRKSIEEGMRIAATTMAIPNGNSKFKRQRARAALKLGKVLFSFILCHISFLFSQRKMRHNTSTAQGEACCCPNIQSGDNIVGRLAQKSRKKVTDKVRERTSHSSILSNTLPSSQLMKFIILLEFIFQLINR